MRLGDLPIAYPELCQAHHCALALGVGLVLAVAFAALGVSAITESEADCIQRDRSWSEHFFDQGAGNRMKAVEGTLWAAYNGVTEWLDHRKIRQSATQRLTSIWFGGANRVKTRALTAAVEMVSQWRN